MPSWMAWLVGIFIDRLFKALGDFINRRKKQAADQEENKNQAAQDMKKAEELKPDATAKETDEAIDDALSHM